MNFQFFWFYHFKTGSSKLIWTAKPPPGKLVATLNHPTNARVQNITLPKSTKGRVITLQLPAGQERELRFREVEVYNGELLGKRLPNQHICLTGSANGSLSCNNWEYERPKSPRIFGILKL